jgi:hypothetical protein
VDEAKLRALLGADEDPELQALLASDDDDDDDDLELPAELQGDEEDDLRVLMQDPAELERILDQVGCCCVGAVGVLGGVCGGCVGRVWRGGCTRLCVQVPVRRMPASHALPGPRALMLTRQPGAQLTPPSDAAPQGDEWAAMLKQLEARDDLDDDEDEAIDVEAEQRLEAQLQGLQRKYSAGRAGGVTQGASPLGTLRWLCPEACRPRPSSSR